MDYRHYLRSIERGLRNPRISATYEDLGLRTHRPFVDGNDNLVDLNRTQLRGKDSFGGWTPANKATDRHEKNYSQSGVSVAFTADAIYEQASSVTTGESSPMFSTPVPGNFKSKGSPSSLRKNHETSDVDETCYKYRYPQNVETDQPEARGSKQKQWPFDYVDSDSSPSEESTPVNTHLSSSLQQSGREKYCSALEKIDRSYQAMKSQQVKRCEERLSAELPTVLNSNITDDQLAHARYSGVSEKITTNDPNRKHLDNRDNSETMKDNPLSAEHIEIPQTMTRKATQNPEANGFSQRTEDWVSAAATAQQLRKYDLDEENLDQTSYSHQPSPPLSNPSDRAFKKRQGKNRHALHTRYPDDDVNEEVRSSQEVMDTTHHNYQFSPVRETSPAPDEMGSCAEPEVDIEISSVTSEKKDVNHSDKVAASLQPIRSSLPQKSKTRKDSRFKSSKMRSHSKLAEASASVSIEKSLCADKNRDSISVLDSYDKQVNSNNAEQGSQLGIPRLDLWNSESFCLLPSSTEDDSSEDVTPRPSKTTEPNHLITMQSNKEHAVPPINLGELSPKKQPEEKVMKAPESPFKKSSRPPSATKTLLKARDARERAFNAQLRQIRRVTKSVEKYVNPSKKPTQVTGKQLLSASFQVDRQNRLPTVSIEQSAPTLQEQTPRGVIEPFDDDENIIDPVRKPTVEPLWPLESTVEGLDVPLSEAGKVSTYWECLHTYPERDDAPSDESSQSTIPALPDEIWLHIFSFLDHPDLSRLMQTCSSLRRIGGDHSLWRSLAVSKQLSDTELIAIANHHPTSLVMKGCTGQKLNGESVTDAGLAKLFTSCENLTHLSVSGCIQAPLAGEAILQHALSLCSKVTILDASWCALTDEAIELIATRLPKLTSLRLTGNVNTTNKAIRCICKGLPLLKTLDVTGCLKLTYEGLRHTNWLRNLESLAIGQCYQLSEGNIVSLTQILPELKKFELKGLKNLSDECLRSVSHNQPELKVLDIGNCIKITSQGLVEMAPSLKHLESLSVRAIKSVTDPVLCKISSCCRNLNHIDVSLTNVTGESLNALIDGCQKLRSIKLSFCKVAHEDVAKLMSGCKRLECVSFYGCRSVQKESLKDLFPYIKIES